MAMDPMMQDSHNEDMHDSEDTSVMIPKSALGNESLKVGDTVMMKIAGMEGDMLKLEPVHDDEEMSSDEMKGMSEEEAMKMPMKDMEKRLPKASREY